jgi:hypothetical protein
VEFASGTGKSIDEPAGAVGVVMLLSSSTRTARLAVRCAVRHASSNSVLSTPAQAIRRPALPASWLHGTDGHVHVRRQRFGLHCELTVGEPGEVPVGVEDVEKFVAAVGLLF